MQDTIDYLKRAIEHAPAKPVGPVAANLHGWWVGPGCYVCAMCAARILDRGCHLPDPAVPVWNDQPGGSCVCCDQIHHVYREQTSGEWQEIYRTANATEAAREAERMSGKGAIRTKVVAKPRPARLT